MKRFIKMNVALAGYTQGQRWPYDKAPDVVKMWLDKKAILVEERICSLAGEDGKPLSSKKTLAQINQEKMDKLLAEKDDDEEKAVVAKKRPKLIKPDRKSRRKKMGRPKGSKNKMKQKEQTKT